MALNLEDKKALVAEVAAVAAKAQSVVAAEYRGLTVCADDRAACQGARAGRVHACGEEHAGTQGARRHDVRICGTEAQGAAGARLLEGRSGRGRARGEGLREGEREAGGDARVASAGRCCPAQDLERVASLPTREQALSMLLGVLKAPIAEARAHARRAAGEAGTHRCRGTRPETGRGRLSVLSNF